MANSKIDLKIRYTISNLDYSKVRIGSCYEVEIYRWFNHRGKLFARVVISELDAFHKEHPFAKYDMLVEKIPIPLKTKEGCPGSYSSKEELNGVMLSITLSTSEGNTYCPDMGMNPIIVEICATTIKEPVGESENS